MRTCINVMMVLLIPSIANASITDSDAPFKAVCVGSQATGFAWRHNEYIPTQFKPEAVMVDKLTVNDRRSITTMLCSSEMSQKEIYKNPENTYVLDKGCYNVHNMDAELLPVQTEICLERWSGSPGNRKLDDVSCKDIQFQPDGNFHQVEWRYSLLQKHVRQKDSMQITVGRCSVMK